MNRTTLKLFILISFVSVISACGKSFTVKDEYKAPTVSSETEFCSTATSYSPGVAVSGTAKYLRRGLNLQVTMGVATSATTGAVIGTALPIKYAEIRVLRNGTTVQCGTTNSLGELRALDGTSQLYLPNDAGTYTIEVYARSNFTFPSTGKPVSATLNAAIKEDIYSNTVYKISGTLTSSGFGGGSNSPLNLVAQADEAVSSKIEGGAFNIYNDWVTTFEYLLSTSNTASLDVSCLNERLDIFWKAGFNPAAYVDPDAGSSTLSFYLREDNELYICGGYNGNVSTIDTDHWDDAVILHEIGHHIENVCGRMDSPGGAHYAQHRIDPRLAWSEAWGNFMGAHIIRNNTAKINPNLLAALPNGEWLHYSDTRGYIEGTPTFNGSMIFMPMNKPGNGAGFGSIYDQVDAATYVGESHFREASIARGLFKGVNTCVDNCGGGIGFDKYWTALGTTINGMGYALSPFSSSAKFFAKVFAANGNSFSASMTTIMTKDESLHLAGSASYTVTVTSTSSGSVSANAWPGFAIKLTTSPSCNRNVLQPRNFTYTSGSYESTFGRDSDQRYNNHFFTIRKSDLAGVSEIRLVPDSSCTEDLDLVVLSSGYYFNEDCAAYNGSGTCISFAKDTTNDSSMVLNSRSSTDSESINLNSLGSSYYLLNVRGYSSNPTGISNTSSCVYKLTDQNGATLCPSTSY